ncbi:MAG: L,D-transpeptidase family protein, partial [Micromonosporaceae bacterium]|nr:L,D-transpeptidase family protein [Micromonosporaceae bacterium]
MARRRTLLTAGFGLAAGFVTTACDGSDARWVAPSASPTSAARLTVTPAADAKDVSPAGPVVIVVESGTLQSVAVTTGTKTVAGSFDSEQRTWRSTGALAYNKTYSVTVTAVDAAGLALAHTSSFTTVKPTATAGVTFQANSFLVLKTGGTYGVGQPVCVNFGRPVKDHDAAEQAMTVETEPAVEGRWRWIDNQNAHWRPARYWTPGTKITVQVNVLGVHLGGGVYGASNASTNFVIGRSQIAKADASTHRMLVYIDGAKVRDIPVSLGKKGTTKTADGKTINYETTCGVHVLLNKEPKVQMSSGSYGVTNSADPNYYDEEVKLCCRITRSGEFVHLADWTSSLRAQGNSNVSHGCINVGPDHAQW